jgi:hypothetical protein
MPQNFLALCGSNYYNGTIFHRNIKGFMIQGGDPTGTHPLTSCHSHVEGPSVSSHCTLPPCRLSTPCHAPSQRRLNESAPMTACWVWAHAMDRAGGRTQRRYFEPLTLSLAAGSSLGAKP